MFLGPTVLSGSAHPTDPAGWNDVAGRGNKIKKFDRVLDVSVAYGAHGLSRPIQPILLAGMMWLASETNKKRSDRFSNVYGAQGAYRLGPSKRSCWLDDVAGKQMKNRGLLDVQ